MPREKLEDRTKKVRKTTGGNAKMDQTWMAEVSEAGELHHADISNKPEGFLYDVTWQWDGYADEVNIDFFESFRRPNNRKCTGTAYIRDETGMYIVDPEWQRLTRPCFGTVVNGTVVCQAHGARIPHVKAAAEKVLAEASEVVAMRLVGLTGPKDELEVPVDQKVRLGAANSVLDRVGIKGGSTLEVEAPGFKKVLDKLFSDDSPEQEPKDG